MRLVLDTNVVVSGLIWRGPPRQLLALGRSGRVALFSSAVLLDELIDVLKRENLTSPRRVPRPYRPVARPQSTTWRVSLQVGNERSVPESVRRAHNRPWRVSGRIVRERFAGRTVPIAHLSFRRILQATKC